MSGGDGFYAVVDPDNGDVTFYHDAALYNCCCEPADFALAVEGMTLMVVEIVQEFLDPLGAGARGHRPLRLGRERRLLCLHCLLR